MVSIDPHVLETLAPHMHPIYWRAAASFNAALVPFGVMENMNRVTHFLAQCLHESSGFRRLRENLFYSTPSRLMLVWPSRFPTVESALPFVRNPEALANRVYGGRLGNRELGDGWKFIGRGPLQLTGRANYEAVGSRLEIDLVGTPELAVHSPYVFPVAGAIWERLDGNRWADLDDVRRVTKAVNGGHTGLLQRIAWLKKVRRAFGVPDVMQA